eukprot:gene7804-12278_t
MKVQQQPQTFTRFSMKEDNFKKEEKKAGKYCKKFELCKVVKNKEKHYYIFIKEFKSEESKREYEKTMEKDVHELLLHFTVIISIDDYDILL